MDSRVNRNPMSILRSTIGHWWCVVTLAATGLWKHYLASERCGLSGIMSHVISLSLRLVGKLTKYL